MLLTIAQLKKLRNRSLRELRIRSTQEAAKAKERLPFMRGREMSDRAWNRELRSESQSSTALASTSSILGRLRDPKGRKFLPSIDHKTEIVQLMDARFPSERLAILARADRVCSGRFDLLGFSDLAFGDPINWSLEPISGKRTEMVHWSEIDLLDPEVGGDKKLIWELNRHQFLVTLGQAYWLTGNRRYGAEFTRLVTSWMDANPPKLGINWASSLEVGLRAISWLWALHLLADSDQVTDHLALRLLKSLTTHGRHIETFLSHYHSPNTHLTGEALALFYLGTALPELKGADRWQKLGLRILVEQLPLQVRPDGVYFEQASCYHRYTTDFYMHLVLLAKATGTSLPDSVPERLQLLLDHLMWITRPDGSSPLYGDDDGGRLVLFGERNGNDFRDTLATGAAVFGRTDWKCVAGDAAVETLWLLGPKGFASYENLNAETPRGCTRAFSAGGYFVMRDGWEGKSSYVLIKCGPHGVLNCGHGHADALSFEFAGGGVNWIIDPGTYTYTADQTARDEFRSSRAHNTVTIDGVSQSVPGTTFAWERIATSTANAFKMSDGQMCFVGSHDGYERLPDPVRHERCVTLHEASPVAGDPAYLRLSDRLFARGHHRYELCFHFTPKCSATSDGRRVRIISPAGDELIVMTCIRGSLTGAVCLPARIESGWVSAGYGQRERGAVAVVALEGLGAQEFTTFIVPVSQGCDVDGFLSRRLKGIGMGMEREVTVTCTREREGCLIGL